MKRVNVIDDNLQVTVARKLTDAADEMAASVKVLDASMDRAVKALQGLNDAMRAQHKANQSSAPVQFGKGLIEVQP